MKIGFDAKRLFLNNTGLGNYSRSLVSTIQKYYPQHEYHLYTTKVSSNQDTKYFLDSSKFVVHECKDNIKWYWRMNSIVKDLLRDKIEVFHGLSAEIPFGLSKTNIKSVVTIHDLIFKYFPKDYSFIDRKIYDLKTKYACVNSDKIISVSNYTANDIVRTYGINEDKINTIYLPLESRFAEINAQDILNNIKTKYSLPDRFFLYVGTVSGRKNLKLIVEAMSSIPEHERINLVVIGNGNKYLQETKQLIQNKKLNDDIRFLTDVSNQDIAKIYQLAKFLVFPSVYEGFGIPALEAIQSNIPVLVSEDTSMVEVIGNCGKVIPKNALEHWAKSIKDYSVMNVDKIDYSKRCEEHLTKFSPSYIAEKLIETYIS